MSKKSTFAAVESYNRFGMSHTLGGDGQSFGHVTVIAKGARSAMVTLADGAIEVAGAVSQRGGVSIGREINGVISKGVEVRTITFKPGNKKANLTLTLTGVSEKGAIRRARQFVASGKVPFGAKRMSELKTKKLATVGIPLGTPVAAEQPKLEIVVKAVRPGFAMPTLSARTRSFRDEPGAEVIHLTPDRSVITSDKEGFDATVAKEYGETESAFYGDTGDLALANLPPAKKDKVSLYARAHGDRPMVTNKQ